MRVHRRRRPLPQLDVKNCKDIYASFDKYCEVEVLEGDNQHNAEQHGMQARRPGEGGRGGQACGRAGGRGPRGLLASFLA